MLRSFLFIFIFVAKGKILYDGYLFQIRMFYQLQNNKDFYPCSRISWCTQNKNNDCCAVGLNRHKYY